MATFWYQAKKGPQEVVEAVLEAASRDEAIERLNQMGLVPVKVQETGRVGAASAVAIAVNIRVKQRLVTQFCRQLAILLKSGVPILNALHTLAEQARDRGFNAVLVSIRTDVKNGKTLSAGMEIFPRVFPRLVVALVQAGEAGGSLEEILIRIAEYREKEERLRSAVRTALTYPALMAVVGAGTVVFMLTFVMPRLGTIFSRLGQELPLPTRVVMKLSGMLTTWWVWLIIAGSALVVGLAIRLIASSPRERLYWSALKLRLPVVGDVLRKRELACFSRTLELLIRSGIQLLRALYISVPTLGNEVLRDAVRRSTQGIEQGLSLGVVLKQSGVFPGFMIDLVHVGEQSGRLDEVLTELAQTYEQETDEAVKILTTLLEPVLILVMGAVIGGIIFAMLLPVFQINVMVR